jgi:hypothetical protein
VIPAPLFFRDGHAVGHAVHPTAISMAVLADHLVSPSKKARQPQALANQVIQA